MADNFLNSDASGLVDDKLQYHDFLNPVGMGSYLVRNGYSFFKNLFGGSDNGSSTNTGGSVGSSLNKLFSSAVDPDYSFNKESSFNSSQAELDRQFQASEAQKNRDFYERLSNTAYQRAVEDMKKAGINPILAYSQGGADTGSMQIANGSRASSRFDNKSMQTLALFLKLLAGFVGSVGPVGF